MKLSDSFIDEKTDKSLEIIVKVFNIIKYKEITGFLDCIKAECNAKLYGAWMHRGIK